MASTAILLKELGWEVSGSDSNFYPPVSDYLRGQDISFKEGYRKENIPSDAEIIVIGKNAKLTLEENEEVREAMNRAASIRSFPEVLEGLVEKTHNIVVAGSFAKSTCTALMTWCLTEAGKNPGYFIGAVPINTGKTAAPGDGKLFILEGDEYPSSNWDTTSKFLHYHPRDVLLTGASHDHINIFPTHDTYLEPFKTLLSLMPPNGLLVASADDKSSRALANTHTGKVVMYSLNEKLKESKLYDISYDFWSAGNMRFGEISTFDLMRSGESVAELETTLLGKHNTQNIVGVSAMLLEYELVSLEALREGVRTFKGVKRRLELLTKNSTVPVYEGFGSSYEKARAAIDAMHLHFPKRRLIVVFEPYEFSWRNKNALRWYGDVFHDCNLVFVYEPAMQGADTHEQLTQDEIVQRVRGSGIQAEPIHSPDEALISLEKELDGNDVVLLMSSGAIGGLVSSIPKLVEKKFPK